MISSWPQEAYGPVLLGNRIGAATNSIKNSVTDIGYGIELILGRWIYDPLRRTDILPTALKIRFRFQFSNAEKIVCSKAPVDPMVSKCRKLCSK
jgi:hypothetical protein